MSSTQTLVSGQDSSESGTLDQAASYTQQVFTTFQFVNSQQFSSEDVSSVQLSANSLALPVCALEIRTTDRLHKTHKKLARAQTHKSNLSSSLGHKIQIKAHCE